MALVRRRYRGLIWLGRARRAKTADQIGIPHHHKLVGAFRVVLVLGAHRSEQVDRGLAQDWRVRRDIRDRFVQVLRAGVDLRLAQSVYEQYVQDER